MPEFDALILENKPIAPGIYSLMFAIQERVAVRCGQFCMVGVPGFPLKRPLAVCKAEEERITVCYQVRGAGTRALAEEHSAGERISVTLPLGNGFCLKPEEKRIALVGGGVGVFPLIAALREFQNQKQLFSYMGFRNREAVCLSHELECGEKLVLCTDDGSCGVRGTAVQAFLADIDDVRPDAVLACGPTPMLRALKRATEGRDIPVYVSLEERMACGIGACLVCVCDKKDGIHARVCRDGPVFRLDEIEL